MSSTSRGNGAQLGAELEQAPAEGASENMRHNGSELEGSLTETLIDERDDVLSVINELEDQLDRYEEIRERLETELSEAHEQRARHEAAIQKFEWQIRSYEAQIGAHEQLRQENLLLEEKITDANARVQRAVSQFEEAEKEIQRLTHELNVAQRQVDSLWSLQKEVEGLKSDLKSANTKRAEADQIARDAGEERNNLRVRLQEAQATLSETRAANQQLEVKLRAAKDSNDELRRIQDMLTGKLETVRNEKKTVMSQLAHLERENARLIEKQQYYEREITSLRNKVRNAEAEVANATRAFTDVRSALLETSARSRRRTLESRPRSISVTLRGAEEPPSDTAD